MKTIHTTKRLYSIAASPPLKSSVRPTPTSPRPRRASLSLASAVSSPSPSSSASGSSNAVGSPSNRSLYTNASGPLHYFDSSGPPPPPPPPTSRPSNPYIVSTSRLSLGEAQTQSAQGNAPGNGTTTHSAQSPHSPHSADGAQPTQQGSHGQSHQGQTSSGQQAEGGSQPILGSSSLMLSLGGPAPPPGSSPPDHGVLSGPRSGLAADQAWRSRETAADAAERQAKEEEKLSGVSSKSGQKIYQLDVGAYGIPKRGRENSRGRSCMCPTCVGEEELFTLDSLNDAVQVGEDAYFVREDALGVADGVGGWGSRASSSRSSSSFHFCGTCAAASTSTASRHVHGRRHSHRAHSAQSSPSALFARRLMHFCAHEVGQAQASVTASRSKESPVAEQNAGSAPIRAKPSLKHGGVAPRASLHGRQKTVMREHGNARPFAWPWEIENNSEQTAGLGMLVEEDLGEEKMAAALGASKENSTSASADARKSESDPLEGTIDPVDVLERAYFQTIDAHRVRRRVRVVKTRKAAPRWWSYGLGLGSTTPAPSSSSLRDTLPVGCDKIEDCEWEWQESWEPLTVGSSTALLAVLSGDRLRVAHLGDCVGWLVRAGEIVWRSEEMWWGFNYPVQLGPSSPTRPADARRYELAVQADDILILASDGMSDNCWEEDVLDEVRRAVEVHLPLAQDSQAERSEEAGVGLLGRRTLAGMLSEALCSRAHQLSMQAHGARRAEGEDTCGAKEKGKYGEAEELPFARRAREEGRSFRGGKCDDISVLVAIISPVSTALTPSSSPVVVSTNETDSISHAAGLSDPVQPAPISTIA